MLMIAVGIHMVNSIQEEGEQIEPGLQGDVAVQLISQDGQEIHAIGR